MNGSLDASFPYPGIDLFSGKVIKRATKHKTFIKGKGKAAEVTKSAIRRLGFQLVEDPNTSEIDISILNNGWEFHHGNKKLYLERIDQLLDELKKL